LFGERRPARAPDPRSNAACAERSRLTTASRVTTRVVTHQPAEAGVALPKPEAPADRRL
jgi:hypothetical protein